MREPQRYNCIDVLIGLEKEGEEANVTQTAFAQIIYAVTAPTLLITSVAVEAKQKSAEGKLFGQVLFDMALLYVAVFVIYQVPIKAGSRTSLLVIAGMGLALLVAATRVTRTLLQAHKLTQQKRRMRVQLAHFKAESSTD
jgi:protein-S-isoprenylcysteine O-methyltransferase Ste14